MKEFSKKDPCYLVFVVEDQKMSNGRLISDIFMNEIVCVCYNITRKIFSYKPVDFQKWQREGDVWTGLFKIKKLNNGKVEIKVCKNVMNSVFKQASEKIKIIKHKMECEQQKLVEYKENYLKDRTRHLTAIKNLEEIILSIRS